jgi:pimeloyl-ACP methyl ester carboxylesterase
MLQMARLLACGLALLVFSALPAGWDSRSGRLPAALPTRTVPPPRQPSKELREPDPLLRDLIGFRVRYKDLLKRHDALVRTVAIRYRAWNGEARTAYLVVPKWYGPKLHPRIALVISPHGRGVGARYNLRFWGGLPAFGPFAVISPEGQGRRLTLYSWGWRGQVDDLARLPSIVQRAVPWFHVDRSRIYAVGGSMGGQETLLLTALHPRLLAGAAALDSATDMTARYYDFPRLRNGKLLQQLARTEIGGTPAAAPKAYAARSPIDHVVQLARSGVPLHIWWSTRDKIVVDQHHESGRLYRAILALNPEAPVTKYVGLWAHTAEMQATARFPLALVKLKLIKLDEPLPPSAKP